MTNPGNISCLMTGLPQGAWVECFEYASKPATPHYYMSAPRNDSGT